VISLCEKVTVWRGI